MSKTPTPLTDAGTWYEHHSGEDYIEVIDADFARRLETELMDAPHGEHCQARLAGWDRNGVRVDVYDPNKACDCWKRDALARVKGGE